MRGHVHLYVCASLFTLCLPLCETVSLLSFFLPRVGDCTACATHDIWDLRDYFHVTIHSRASHIWISIRLVHKFVSFTYLSISWAWRGQSEPGGRSALRQTRQSRRNPLRTSPISMCPISSQTSWSKNVSSDLPVWVSCDKVESQ